MKYDDWSWHSGREFPAGLPPEAGAIHIGMFVAWALLHGLTLLTIASAAPFPKMSHHKKRYIFDCSSIEACAVNVRISLAQGSFFETDEDVPH